MRAEIRNKIELWWIPENDDPAIVGEIADGVPVYVCEDVTDVDAVAAYLDTLRLVRGHEEILPSNGSQEER